ITIIIGQLKDFFGLTFTQSPVETMWKLEETARCINTLNPAALGVGCLALAILFFWPKFFKKVPSSLIAVLVTAAAVKLLNLPVNTIGDLYTIS
ncbi:MAG: SulP family inorganic anion transporter, partial [Firmicutes bacterium]|nr:SulP family inorganic anion transporter [Bacillota bacterium]